MLARDLLSEKIVAGWLLILSGVIFTGGGMLYTGRAIWKWPAGQARGYLIWERGFVITAVLVATLGLVLLERLLEAAGDRILPPLGLTLWLISATLMTAAETFSLSQQAGVYAPIVVSVILAFVGQAVFGMALLRTGLLPGWVGWFTIIWNLAWLIILPVARPSDMYYPWLHYMAPLLIGIALLLKR